jgi:uncharacterized protein
VRLDVHVVPGARSASVGGARDGRLVVRVRERAVDGAATDAVRRAIAVAFEVRARDVTVVAGATSRRKVLEIVGDKSDLNEVAATLRNARD